MFGQLVRATGVAAALTLVFATSAVAHGSAHAAPSRERTIERTLDSGKVVTLHTHSDPRHLGAPPSALKGSLARAAAGDPTPWLADAWCGAARTTDDIDHELNPTSRSLHAVYAYPSDQPNRFAQYASPIQYMLKGAANIIATTGGSGKSLRIDQGTNCGGQYIDITTVKLAHTAAELQAYEQAHPGDAYWLPESDVRAALPFHPSKAPSNLVIFADYHDWSGWGGQATAPDDDTPGLDNYADLGHQDAVIYGYGSAYFVSDNPEWATNVTLHEIGHNLGAVSNASPHSTQARHCFDEWDIMCYADGGASGSPGNLTYTCDQPGEVWDCGMDDYFNPAPAAGSFLAANWNTYSNLGLCTFADCGQSPTPAQVDITLDRSPFVGESVTATAHATTGGTPVVGYVWDWNGDGWDDTGFGTPEADSAFWDEDLHTMSVRAFLADGRTAWAQTTIKARPETPAVILTASDAHPITGKSVHLEAVRAGNSTPAASFKWYDNGEYAGFSDTGDSSSLDRQWSQAGEHFISVTMYTKLGQTGSAGANISVKAPPVVVTPPTTTTTTTPTVTTPTTRPNSGTAGITIHSPDPYVDATLGFRGSRRLSILNPTFTFTAPLASTVTVTLRTSRATARRLKLRSTRIALRSIFLLHNSTSKPHLSLPRALRVLRPGTRILATLTLSADTGDVAVRHVTLVR